ncbi:uncharacterized protein [Diadema setosum]|uniref:uncharacterized protein n=1 Tax=Diadema setosum TaxID=31175 RepID=UPI003B3BBED1
MVQSLQDNHQPHPAINSYVIKADGVTLSQSSSPTTHLSPRPRWCIELSCEGRNDLGQTSITSIYCPRASHTRPFPPINRYVIKRDRQNVSTSNSVTLSPRPERCTNFTCIGENDNGSASSVETYCPKNPPRDRIIDIEFDENVDDSGGGIVTISCHVNDIDQPYPALERYEIQVGSVTVSNSSSSSFTVSPSPPGCTNVTCIGMNELGSTSTVNEFCPTDPPGEDIITLQIEEQIVASEVNLEITCHIDPRDQPTPPIDSYEISVDGDTISSSSVPSAIVESRPNKCINIICEGRNRHGSTRSTDLYCFKDDIIDVQFNERVGENNGKIYTVVCHIDEEYQPTPGIHTFLITADNVTLSSSRSPSTAFTPRADGGTEVTCTGWNDFGSTTATKTFCPSAVEIIAEFQRQGALQRSSTTYALLVVVFFLSVIVCVAYVNRRRAFFPPDQMANLDSWRTNMAQVTVTGGIILLLAHSCAAVTFTVPSTLTANRQVTARCTESGVLESQTASWFLDGVQITEGVVTNSNQARRDKGWGYQGSVRSSQPTDTYDIG